MIKTYMKLFPITLPLGGLYGLYTGIKSYYLLEKEIIKCDNYYNKSHNINYIKYSYITNCVSLGVLSGFMYPATLLYIISQTKK